MRQMPDRMQQGPRPLVIKPTPAVPNRNSDFLEGKIVLNGLFIPDSGKYRIPRQEASLSDGRRLWEEKHA